MSDDSEQKSVYFNVVLPLNAEYYYVLDKLKRGDCRVKYLRDFLVILGMSTENQLSTYDSYKKFDEDPNLRLPEEKEDTIQWITESKFRAILNVYAEIMREAGLVAKSRGEMMNWGGN